MQDIIPYFLTFIVAFAIAFLQLETALYPHTNFLMRKRPITFVYCAFYGLVGALFYGIVVYSGINMFIGNKVVADLYIQALLVGFFSKGISDWNFYTLPIGTDAKPIGIKTFIQPIESTLLTRLDEEEYNSLKEYITSDQVCCRDVNDALDKITNHGFPSSASQGETRAYIKDR